jgi:hypothetical protein
MNLLPAANRFRGYEIEFGAGGNRLGCKFCLDDGSVLFVHESDITTEIESLIACLGSPTKAFVSGDAGEKELHRQLFEQFFEASKERYGRDSEQARMFALYLE